MRQNYFIDAAMTVRRQVDEHRDCISLVKLLKRIRSNPSVLSRERYWSICSITTAYGDPGASIDAAFDRLVGEGRDFIDPWAVEEDIRSMNEVAGPIKDYADNIIAHFDKRSLLHDYPLDLKMLNYAIETFERVLDKYHELLFGTGIGFNPIPPTPWYDIFKVPWIPTE